MPYIGEKFLDSLPKVERNNLMASTVQFGYHPETRDAFIVSNSLRQSGTQIIGVTGVGKSSLLQNLIMQDIYASQCVMAIDPHRDLIRNCISALHPAFLSKAYLLDIEDWQYPFGLNLFATHGQTDRAARELILARIGHVFEVQWPEMVNQMYLQMYLRMSILPLLCMENATMLDLYRFVTRTEDRWNCLNQCPDEDVRNFWTAFESMRKEDREQQIMPLRTRLHLLFAGRPTIQGVIGQARTTLNIRRSIEERETLFVHLPLRTMKQDAQLIGTLFIALIHEATFSFGQLPESERPGFSLYVDEAHNWASKDFNQLLTEGRKFGARVTISHQSLGQLPPDLQRDVQNVATKVAFHPTNDDALPLAVNFVGKESRLESVETHPVKWLLEHETGNPQVQTFVNAYLHPLLHRIRYGQVEIDKPGLRLQDVVIPLLSVDVPKTMTKELDPTWELDKLLREVMETGNPNLPVPSRMIAAFGNGDEYTYPFYATFKWALKSKYLNADIRYPKALVVERGGQLIWTRKPQDAKEQLYHFIFHLRQTMAYLAANPLGRRVFVSEREIARDLLQLPTETAYIRSGEDIGVIYMDDTEPLCGEDEFTAKFTQIRVQTRLKYCSNLEPPTEAMPAVLPKPPLPPQPPTRQPRKRGQ